ncbi:hypothetical protein A6P39_042180 (plasmid) [Streptomyces sp. FXJ1.172]|uniref:hypothetical protein n=1 Tax=Streptomyces sp. FXJ1.172 TaxID=710705 RepID=UPI0023DD30F4|nr:hypothetical protein [Streptomyces sp. FXJ1.172]WEP00783.1 hypothetical protein A6P39_042180 [Streptomyces sp. FXJ1.172]
MTATPSGVNTAIEQGSARGSGNSRHNTIEALTVSHAGEHMYLVHTGSRLPMWLTRLADRLSPTRPGEAVVLIGAPLDEDGVEGLCRRLAPVLEASRDARVRLLVLVMSEGADEAEGRPSAARLICERWGFDVLATAGSALVTADGALFSPDLPGMSSSWWHFSPGAPARCMSSHLPVPDWEAAVRRVGRQTVAGHVVEPVPAGLAVRPVGPASLATRIRLHSIPPEHGRPQLILASPDIPTAALAVVMGTLPEHVRGSLRLMFLAGRPMLRTGQEVADLLGCDVHVAVGAPLVSGGIVPDDASAGDAIADQYLFDAVGRPAWRPFAQTVVHAPAAGGDDRPIRVTQWRVPPVLAGGTEPDALSLGRHWKVAVTPAGLWVGPRDAQPPLLVTARPASADTVALDLGATHRTLDESLWPELDTLFEQLEPEVCVRAVVHVHGVLGTQDRERLLELTVRHGLRQPDPEVAGRSVPVAHHGTGPEHTASSHLATGSSGAWLHTRPEAS